MIVVYILNVLQPVCFMILATWNHMSHVGPPWHLSPADGQTGEGLTLPELHTTHSLHANVYTTISC